MTVWMREAGIIASLICATLLVALVAIVTSGTCGPHSAYGLCSDRCIDDLAPCTRACRDEPCDAQCGQQELRCLDQCWADYGTPARGTP